MKTLIATLAAAVAVTAAVPAAAAHPGERHGRYERSYAGDSINARQHELNRMIEIGLRRGALTVREARNLQAQARDVAVLENRYARGGMTRWEAADLHRRMDQLEMRIARHMQDRQYGYGYGHGRWR